MAVNIEEIAGYARRNAAAAVRRLQAAKMARAARTFRPKPLTFPLCTLSPIAYPPAMNLRLQVQLNMVGVCITVAQSSDYKPAWNGKPLADFGTDIVQLATDYGAVTAKAAQADGATGGAADAKAVAETALEDAAFVLARALTIHFKKTGDLDRHGKVDVTKSEIMKLRTQELVNKTTSIRDLGTAAVSEAGAAGRGVTAARVATTAAAQEGRFPRSARASLGKGGKLQSRSGSRCRTLEPFRK